MYKLPDESSAMPTGRKRAALTALINFYARQDWGRLRDMMEIGETKAIESTPQEAQDTFTIVCRVVSLFWNMSYQAFLDLRFEEAAGLIILANKAWDEKDGEGKLRVDQFLQRASGMVTDLGECEDIAIQFMPDPAN